MPPLLDPLVAIDKPPPPLGVYLLRVAVALDTMNTGHVPGIDPKMATVSEAAGYMRDRRAQIWPGLVTK